MEKGDLVGTADGDEIEDDVRDGPSTGEAFQESLDLSEIGYDGL